MSYSPDFELTPDLEADWADWYSSVLEIKTRRLKEDAIERFAKSHGLTVEQAWLVDRVAGPQYGQEEEIVQLAHIVVDEMYTITEAPWQNDYDRARIFAARLLFVHNNKFEVDKLYEEFEDKLSLTPDKMDYFIFLASKWKSHFYPKGKYPRRSDWKNLDEVSPYAK